MPALSDLVKELQNELNKPAVDSLNLATQRHLDLKSVRVKLQFQIVSSGASKEKLSLCFSNPTIEKECESERSVSDLRTTAKYHELELIWAVPDSPALQTNGVVSTNLQVVGKDTSAPTLSEEDLLQQFILIFGEPGFDSSARATVFLEVLSECTDEDLTLLTHSLDLIAPSGLTDSQKALRHRVLCVIRSGPTASIQKGSHLLREILIHLPRSQCIGFIIKHWKTQADWLDT